MRHQDRYLTQRGNTFQYNRRVPVDVVTQDQRGDRIKRSLRTNSLLEARQLRNMFEYADEQYWLALRSGYNTEVALNFYDKAVQQLTFSSSHTHTNLKFNLDTPSDDFGLCNLADVDRRRDDLSVNRGTKYNKAAKPVSVILSEYVDHLRNNIWLGKSSAQMNMSEKPVQRAVHNFTRVCGDLPLNGVSKEHAIQLYNFWRDRVAKGEVSWSTANRDLGNMRCLFRYHNSMSGLNEITNPFEGLMFSKPRHTNKRPSFSMQFVNNNWVNADSSIQKMKNSALIRAIFVMIGTGCRPSEVFNLLTSNIILSEDIPYIKIRDRDGRELKTSQSNRDIPLFGIALVAVKKQLAINPKGFEEFHDREASMTTAIGKFMRENISLKESEAHTLYSFRHMAEDLAKDANLDLELRMELFGHSKNRPEYGRGYSIKAKLLALERMYTGLNQGSVRSNR